MTKPYKCRVEYLESTGTQWIDTGIAPSNITPIAKMKFIPTQQYSSGSYGIFGCFGANNTRFQVFYNSIGIGTYVSKAWQANTTYEVELNGKIPSATINGTVETSGYSTANGFSSDNMYLFTRNNGNVADNGVPLKLYYCKIWNNELLVRDFIPVLDLSGKPAMYDQVSGKLFYNKGTGEFTYGRQIIPVEYLESNGGQFIDTGINPTDTYGYRIKNTYTVGQGEQCAIGCMDGGNRFVGVYTSGSSNAISGAWGSYVGFLPSYPWTTGTILDVQCNYKNNRQITIDNTEVKDISDIHITGTISNSIYIGARNYGSNVTKMQGKIYGVEITNGTEVIANYIPAIDENHIPFMFDLVNCTVYLNAGTGQFKVGPNVEKMWGGKKLRRKLALMLATLKKKRKYYTELEYLESTGTQYIDTGLKGKNNIDFDYKCIFTNLDGTAQCVGGNWSGAGQSTVSLYLGLIRTNGNFAYHYDGTQSPVVVMNTTVQDTPYSVQGHMWVGEQYMVINGTKSSVGTISSTFTSSLNMYLFGINNNGLSNPAYMKLYYCKIYDNGVLVRDYIPVLDWNMKPCMFDKVTEQLFYNQATSGNDFSYGREIHYVDYLESTGTQYIDTGLKSAVNMSVKTKFNLANVSSKAVFGSYSGSASNGVGVFFGTAGGNISGKVYCNNTNIAVSPELVLSANTTYEIEMSGSILVLNNSEYTTATTADNNYNMILFARSNNGTVERNISGKIYYFIIKDNNTLVRDYIPAIDSDGVGFMFDRVSHTIFDNAGSGSFVPASYQLDSNGRVVEPEYE